MTNEPTPEALVTGELPTLSEKVSGWLGFKLPLLPQTVKNADKAIGRLVFGVFEWLVSFPERDTALRRAKTKAEEQVIDAAGKRLSTQITAGDPIAERALDYTFRESVLKQRNREAIARRAIEHVIEKAEKELVGDTTDQIEEDWLNEFSELASKKSNADIQSLWAKILSGKIRNPGSFSLQSLHLLSVLDASDANHIHNVLSYTIMRYFIYQAPSFTDISQFVRCEELGVLSNELVITIDQNVGTRIEFPMSTINLYAESVSNTSTQIQIPCFKLTRFGSELYALSEGFERNIQYEQEFIDFLKASGAKVFRQPRQAPLGQVSVPLEEV